MLDHRRIVCVVAIHLGLYTLGNTVFARMIRVRIGWVERSCTTIHFITIQSARVAPYIFGAQVWVGNAIVGFPLVCLVRFLACSQCFSSSK